MVIKIMDKVFKILIKVNFNFLSSHLKGYLMASSFPLLALVTSLKILVFSFNVQFPSVFIDQSKTINWLLYRKLSILQIPQVVG